VRDKLRLYLDMCVYNRPFDDQSQPRIMLETQFLYYSVIDFLSREVFKI